MSLYCLRGDILVSCETADSQLWKVLCKLTRVQIHTAPGLEATMGILIHLVMVTNVNQIRPLRLPGTWTVPCYVFYLRGCERRGSRGEGWMEAEDWPWPPLKGTAWRKMCSLWWSRGPSMASIGWDSFPLPISGMLMWIRRYHRKRKWG